MATVQDLKALAPQVEAILAPVKAAGMQCHEGLLLHLQNLYTALQAGDYRATGNAVKEIINCLFGEDPPVMRAKMGDAAGKIDWNKFGELLKTLLPILISLFA